MGGSEEVAMVHKSKEGDVVAGAAATSGGLNGADAKKPPQVEKTQIHMISPGMVWVGWGWGVGEGVL